MTGATNGSATCAAAGVTLIEVLVALTLLAVGGLTLAAGLTVSVGTWTRSVASAQALAAAENWIEDWRAAPWDSAAPPRIGADTVDGGARGVARDWSVRSVTPCESEARIEAVPLAAGGRSVRLASRRFHAEWAGCGP